MTILHAAASGPTLQAARLIGVGATGARFVQSFHASAPPEHPPLAQLREEPSSFILIAGGQSDALLDPADLGNARLLFLAFGADARPAEIEAAMHLVWGMWAREGHVIGVVIAGEHLRPSGDSMLGVLCDAIDARIDVPDDDPETLGPLQWFYLGLRRAILDGTPLLLEAAWDCDDVVETLGLPEVELVLLAQPFDSAAQLPEAMVQALEELSGHGPGIERAQGMLIVLWAPREHGLTVRDVRGVGRQAALAMGAGALHLTIRLGGNAAPGVPGVLTLVVSFSRLPISLSPQLS
ncbi:hypothetical protein [Variovorax sp. Sphag1AA]|uniref:hypothetical protein n=1 Tax=Variovorax sp. Sphag1AA TaxID=2587027 RepID=UPI0016125096|nr:hypothetical protein [Variovorax sp. Sphag1AA]MBB3178821.1 hypothetical protein [Variovorax sp. Sphag1AA]